MNAERKLIESAFSRSALFEGMTPDSGWFVREYRKGDNIPESPDGIGCVGVIIRGCAQVSPREQGAVSVLTQGAEFGICNIFVAEEMPTVLTAKTACLVAYIPKERFADRLSSDSVLMYRYVRLCNEKMIYLADKLRLMSIPGCEARLAYWLSKTSAGRSRIKINLRKDELARWLGMSRASLFRAITGLERKGVIKSFGDIITILKSTDELLELEGGK